jgi:hypothetical protein
VGRVPAGAGMLFVLETFNLNEIWAHDKIL